MLDNKVYIHKMEIAERIPVYTGQNDEQNRTYMN